VSVLDGAAFVLDHPAEVPAVWGRGDENLWSRGEPLYILGPTGIGKTTLQQQLALRRAGIRTSDLLGLPVETDTRPVLYIAADRHAQARRSFQRMVGEEDRALLRERLLVYPGRPFDLAGDPEALHRLCVQEGAGSVFLDSAKDMVVGDLADPSVGRAYNDALQLTVNAGIEAASAHHQKKGRGEHKPRTLDDMYGSVWLGAGAGSVVLLWGEAGDVQVELLHLKQPAAVVGPWTVSIDHATGTVHRNVEKENKLGDAVASFLAVYPASTSSEIARNVGAGRPAVEHVLEADDRFGRVEPGEARRKDAKLWALLVSDARTSSDKNGTQPPLACLPPSPPMGAGGTSNALLVQTDEAGTGKS
jgi:replicative DNA helicase